MNKQTIYNLLEDKQLTYTDYLNVIAQDSGEPLVAIKAGKALTAQQKDAAMIPYTGNQVFVRQTVLKKLQSAAKILNARDDTLKLEVVYGYRTLTIQTQIFEKHKKKLSKQYTGEELASRTHKFIAVPEVAGHPAGAAVDIQILRGETALDFGTKIWEFQPDSFTFSPFISKEAWNNRQLLRQTMTEAGFAPFDGEWWHFSYGDKEWAKYYDKPQAIYEQVNFKCEEL